VLVIPGAAVRDYVRPAVEQLRSRGIDAELLPAPGEPGTAADLAEYGRTLGRSFVDHEQSPVDLLVGLSVGAQAAAVATATPSPPGPPRIRRLMLISPTVDPTARRTSRLIGRWLAGGRVEPLSLLPEQAPDWWRAGPRRLARIVRSATTMDIERVLPAITVPVDIVHAERDLITSHAYSAQLAASHPDARLILLPAATHSWPHADEHRFADLIDTALNGRAL
jgi:pimeloyl-ACP methyl ester carboxylesterase